jgi:hypothetical protein
MVKLAKEMPARSTPFEDVVRSLVAPTSEPWVVLEGGWWKPAPNRPDYRPRSAATLFAPVAPGASLKLDLALNARHGDVPGALAPP